MAGSSTGKIRPNDCSTPVVVRTRKRRAAGSTDGNDWASGAKQPVAPLSQPMMVTSATNEMLDTITSPRVGIAQYTVGAGRCAVGDGTTQVDRPPSATPLSVVIALSAGAPVSDEGAVSDVVPVSDGAPVSPPAEPSTFGDPS